MNENLDLANSSTDVSRRKRRAAGIALIAALAALALGVWLWRRTSRPEPPLIDLAQIDPEIAEAISAARQQVVRNPFSALAWGRLAMVLRAHEYGEESLRCFAQAESLDAQDPRWPYLQGLTLVQTDTGAGIACLERAVERCGDEPVAPRLRLTEALLDLDRLEEAERHLNQALELEPANPRVRFNQGRLALARQDWRSALGHLTVCLQDEHARRRALSLRALAYRRLGEPKHALEDQRAAAELPEDEHWPDPFADAVLRLQCGLAGRMMTAESCLAEGRYDQAIPILEDTAKRYPTSFHPRLRLAEFWRAQGRLDLAEQACRQAVQAAPESQQAWFELGCFQARNRPGEAAESFRRAIRLKPDHALAHFNLAHCLRQQGDLAGAAEEYGAALHCRPDYEAARTALKAVEAKVKEGKE